jgi:hypothetical protein
MFKMLFILLLLIMVLDIANSVQTYTSSSPTTLNCRQFSKSGGCIANGCAWLHDAAKPRCSNHVPVDPSTGEVKCAYIPKFKGCKQNGCVWDDSHYPAVCKDPPQVLPPPTVDDCMLVRKRGLCLQAHCHWDFRSKGCKNP